MLDLRFRNFEKLKNFKKAFKVINQKNVFVSNLNENKKYDKKNFHNMIEAYKKFYINKEIDYSYTNNHPNIVFIIGFPRSGTT